MTTAAIDYGKRRLGIAAADPLGIVVYPAGIIRRTSLKRDLAMLSARLKQLEVSRVIIGLPLNMDGSAGPIARAAEKFAQQVGETTGLPVELYDERLSTFEARERLRASPRKAAPDGHLDALAATVILESWLRSSGQFQP